MYWQRLNRSSLNHKSLDDGESSLSGSTSYASSVLSRPEHVHPSSTDHVTPPDGPQLSWQVLQDVEENDDDGNNDDRLFTISPLGADSRAAAFNPTSTIPAEDPEVEPTSYRLLEDESPRPATPFSQGTGSRSLKGRRPVLMTQDAVIKEEAADGSGDEGSASHQTRGTAQRKAKSPRSASIPRQRVSPRVAAHAESAGKEELRARDNKAFMGDEDGSSGGLTNVQSHTHAGQKAFPYTTEYLDFKAKNAAHTLPSYGLVDQDIIRGEEKKKQKPTPVGQDGSSKDILFAPRKLPSIDKHYNITELPVDDIDEDQSDDGDSITTSEDVFTPRMNHAKTDRVISTDKIHSTRSEANIGWQITDCDLVDDDDGDTGENPGPRVLPGAKGAQQLPHSASGRKTPEISGLSMEARRRGMGQQYDSRRKYIALNSLRRKSNQAASQAELRKNKPADGAAGSSPRELIEFWTVSAKQWTELW